MDLGPRSGQVYRDLRAQIEGGTLPVGMAIPSQSTLAREYGVAVMTVRQALERLQAEGFVQMRVGAGTFVAGTRPAGVTTPSGLRSMIAAAPLPIISLDPAGIVTSWNPAAERMFGWPATEIVGQPIPLIPADREDEFRTFLRETLEGRPVHDVETVRLRRDGTPVMLSLSTAPLRDDEDNTIGIVFTYLDLTGRKRAEEALHESRERFEGAFDHAAIGMAIVGLDGRFLQVNRALCELTGYPREELVALTFQDITHPEDLETDLAHVRQMLAGETQTYRMEKRYFRKDGRLIWILLAVSLVHTAEGAPLHFVSQISDITERKEAVAALQRSEAWLRSLIQGAPVGVVITTPEGILEQANDAFAEIVGYEVGELVGESYERLFAAEQRARIAQLRVERYSYEGKVVTEHEMLRRDGTTATVLVSGVPLETEGGDARRASFVIDISGRRQTEKALETGERRLRTLINQAPVGVSVFGPTGLFEQVNDAYASMFGYEPEDLVGRHYSIVVPPEGLERLARAAAGRGRSLGTTSLGEHQLLHREGRRVTILTTTVAFDPDEPGRLAVFALDISDRKEAEQALEHRATHDALTGLANRLLLQDRLQQVIAHARRYGEVVGLLFIDLDGFKEINDRFGHAAGDELLKQASARLTGCMRASDTIARLAGDEFVAVLPDIGSAAGAIRVAQKVLDTLGASFHVGGTPVELAASIGISLYPFDGDTLHVLLRAADEAMYRAKREGANRYALHAVGES